MNVGMNVDQAGSYSDTDLHALAESLDCSLVIGDANTLLVDLDSEFSASKFQQNLAILKQRYGVESVDRYPSRKQRIDPGFVHEHVIVKLQAPIDDIVERLLLQAALGSDPTKELCSLARARSGHPTPSVLFRPRRRMENSKQDAADDWDAIFA